MPFPRRLRYVLPRSALDVLVLLVLALGVALVVTARRERADYYAHEVRREVTAKLSNVDERTEDVWDVDDEEWDTHYFYRVTYRCFLDDKPYTYTREYEDSAPRSSFAQEEKVHAYQGVDGVWHLTEFSRKSLYGWTAVGASALCYAIIVAVRLRNG